MPNIKFSFRLRTFASHSALLQMKVLTWLMLKKEFKGSPHLHINWWYGESTAFKDFTLQQQCRLNRFSQSASWAWSVMCVLVLLRVYICASTNYSLQAIFMVKGTERAVVVFLGTKGGARAAAVAPQLPSWHRSWVETQIHGESAVFPLGPNREHMSHVGFSHRPLDRTVRRAANLLSYFIMPGSVTHGNATLVKVDLRPCGATLLRFCDLSKTRFHKKLFKHGPNKFRLLFAWRETSQMILASSLRSICGYQPRGQSADQPYEDNVSNAALYPDSTTGRWILQ